MIRVGMILLALEKGERQDLDPAKRPARRPQQSGAARFGVVEASKTDVTTRNAGKTEE